MSSGTDVWIWVRDQARLARRYLGLDDLRAIRWILIAGLAIRIALLPLTAHPWDDYVWYSTSNRIYSGLGLYGGSEYTYGYPPVWAGFLTVTDGLYRLANAPLGVHPITAARASFILHSSTNLGAPLIVDWLYVALAKAPLVVFDFLTTALLYRIVSVRLGRPDLGRTCAALFFLNPFVILISSVWGQFDILATYLLLVGTLLYVDNRPYLAGIFWGLSVMTKYFPIIVVVAVIAAYAGTRPKWNVLRSAYALGVVVAAISLPFLIADPSTYLAGVTGPTRGSPGTESLSLWSYLSQLAPHYVPNASWFVPGLLLLVLAVSALGGWLVARRAARGSIETVWVDAAIVATLVFYLAYRTVNEQYLIWIMPFLALEVARSRFPLVLYALVSALAVIDSVFSLNGTSFFLPTLTISHTLGRQIPLENLPPIGIALAFATWGTLLVVLFVRVFTYDSMAGRPPRSRRIGQPSGANPSDQTVAPRPQVASPTRRPAE
jgi:Glycosyltransferase family 87